MSWVNKLKEKQSAMGLTVPKSEMPQVNKILEDPMENNIATVISSDPDKNESSPVEAAQSHVPSLKPKIIFDEDKTNSNKGDYHALEWGRHRDAGFRIGRKFNYAPLFFTADSQTVHLEDSARGSSIIIIGSGITPESTKVIRINNFCTFGVDSIPYITNFWASLKDPSLINTEIFNRPNIIKFVPMAFSTINDKSGIHLANKPMVFYYRRSENFTANFLIDDCIYAQSNNVESIYLSVIKICYVMGFRKMLFCGINITDTSIIEKITDLSPSLDNAGLKFHTSGCNFNINDIEINNF